MYKKEIKATFEHIQLKDELLIKDILEKMGIYTELLKNPAIQSLIDYIIQEIKKKKIMKKRYEMIKKLINDIIIIQNGNVYIEKHDYIHCWEKKNNNDIEERIVYKKNNGIKITQKNKSNRFGIEESKLYEEKDTKTKELMKLIFIKRDETDFDKIIVEYKEKGIKDLKFEMSCNYKGKNIQYILSTKDIEEIIKKNNLLSVEWRKKCISGVFYQKLNQDELNKSIDKCEKESVKEELCKKTGIERDFERVRVR